MKNTNPVFSLKNFRSFGEDGADFELAPITVLTGCNSAGKSSMSKALVLLSKLPKGRNCLSPSLKLYAKDLILGNFEKVLHRHANSNEIVFAYKIWSNYLQEEVTVKRFFKSQTNDTLNDGCMYRYSIEKNDGTIVIEKDLTFQGMGDEKKNKKSWEAISKNYNNFFLASKYQKLVWLVDIIRDHKKEFEDYLREFEDTKLQLEKNKINIEDYKYRLLEGWNCWYSKRTKKIESWKDVCKTREDVEEMIATHFPEDEICDHYIELVADEVLSPWFTEADNVNYINSSSASISRTYSVEDENKMSDALRKLNNRKVSIEEYKIDDILPAGYFVNKWLGKDKFNLGKISIEGNGEGGIKIFLKNNEEKRLLADEGYGITQLVSLLLLIDNAIKAETERETPWKDGLPDYKDIDMSFCIPAQIICVEEPENHLHPKYQSLLAEMFVEAYQKYNIHFIIETHSEYLIRKLQVLVADKENALTSNDVSLNYVEKDENGISHNRQIKILEDGRLSEPFGPGFFDEATDLSMRLLKMKMEAK